MFDSSRPIPERGLFDIRDSRFKIRDSQVEIISFRMDGEPNAESFDEFRWEIKRIYLLSLMNFVQCMQWHLPDRSNFSRMKRIQHGERALAEVEQNLYFSDVHSPVLLTCCVAVP